MKNIRIGISGWRYPPWRGTFYPKGLAQHRELEFASHALSTIEINGSFYSLQRPESYALWYASTPPDFVFSLKAPRFITHIRRLDDVQLPVANFLASGLFRLKEKLGPILWQLPPTMRYDPSRIETFLKLLPHDTKTALSLARKREARMTGRAALAIDSPRSLRHAVEVRNPSFIDARFVNQLREHRVALVIADSAGKFPYFEDVTADFVYLRLHGASALYAGGYDKKSLARWKDRIALWAAGGKSADTMLTPGTAAPARTRRVARDVFCYFDNTMKIMAPANARRLMEMLGLPNSR